MMIKNVLVGIGALVLIGGMAFGAYSLIQTGDALAQGPGTGYSQGLADGTGLGLSRGNMQGQGMGQRFSQEPLAGAGQGLGQGANQGGNQALANCDGDCRFDTRGQGQIGRQSSGYANCQSGCAMRSTTGRGQGQTWQMDGAQGQYMGRGQGAGQGLSQRDGTNFGLGTPQATAHDWMTVSGQITAVDQTELLIATDAGDSITLSLGPEQFWSVQGVSLSAGDQITAQVFEEDGETKVGSIETDAGQTLVLRDELGRPLWAGGGQGQNRR